MPRPWELLDRVDSQEGPLELRRRDAGDFMISVGGRVLMSSTLHRSELAVAELACARLKGRPAPRVLVGGLGLGFTLRAVLDSVAGPAQVVVAELNEAVVRWCHGPLAALTDHAAGDARVAVRVADVCDLIREAARGGRAYDAIILDLYVGPADLPRGAPDPLYGTPIVRDTFRALGPGGVYSVWAEDPAPSFERRLRAAGFEAELVRTRGGGPRHAVYLATRPGGGGASRGRTDRGRSRRQGR